jgi:hypothetical protein
MTGSLSKVQKEFNRNPPVVKTLPIKRPKIAVRRGFATAQFRSKSDHACLGCAESHIVASVSNGFFDSVPLCFGGINSSKFVPRYVGHSPRLSASHHWPLARCRFQFGGVVIGIGCASLGPDGLYTNRE